MSANTKYKEGDHVVFATVAGNRNGEVCSSFLKPVGKEESRRYYVIRDDSGVCYTCAEADIQR